MFHWNSKTKMEKVLDGLSHTIAVGERAGRVHKATWVGTLHGTHLPSWRVIGWAGALPNETADDAFEEGLFSSEHGRMTNFVFGDGSVHTINDHIDARAFQALATIAGDDTHHDCLQ